MENSSDHWPHVFDALKARLAAQGDHIVLAETWENEELAGQCARSLTCGLVREEEYENVTGEQDLGHDVSSNGPYPTPGTEEYMPWFSIFGTAAIPDGLEPLVLSWESNNRTVLQPDPGLLMTYGLVPRVEGNGIIHWDEPAAPTPDILVVNPVAVYEHLHKTTANVTIRKEYLQDYATLRQRAVVCVFSERWIVEYDQEAGALLGDQRYLERRFRDAYFRIQRIQGEAHTFHIDIWGHRLLLRPGPLPISEDADRYGELTWPGITDPVNDENWAGQGMTRVCVTDGVLSRFEGRPEYAIDPESGSVSFGAEWTISYCTRVERDLISLEVRKLYEGTSPDIVRHFHRYAVEHPPGSLEQLGRVRNIGHRARYVVYATVGLGAALAEIASRVLGREVMAQDVVSLDRRELAYFGWWKGPGVEPVCRHAPRSATQEAFVERCKDLHKLVVEGLSEKVLRQTLRGLGVAGKDIDHLRSLKLLSRLVELGEIAQKGGFDLVGDCAVVVERFDAPARPSPCSHLFALNELRQLDTHRQGTDFVTKLATGLTAYGIDPASTAPGYGLAIDAVYDELAAELQRCAQALGYES